MGPPATSAAATFTAAPLAPLLEVVVNSSAAAATTCATLRRPLPAVHCIRIAAPGVPLVASPLAAPLAARAHRTASLLVTPLAPRIAQ
jgi:hypothetical protein